VRAMLCSTGLRAGSTPRGTFYMPPKRYRTERGPWHHAGSVLVRYASRIKGPYLFHSILYSQRRVSSLQRASWSQLGRQASAGCIRLTPLDAQWIAYNCGTNTRVVITTGKSNPERKELRDQLKSAMPAPARDGTLGEWEPTLLPTPAPTPAPLQLNSAGSSVTKLQIRLKALGFFPEKVTGKFQTSTERAVKRFQQAAELEETGVVLSALQTQIYALNAPTGTFVTLKKGDKGPAVLAMQQRLKNLNLFTGTPNGTYASGTVRAVRAFYASANMKMRDTATPEMQRLLKEQTDTPSPLPSPAPLTQDDSAA